jgi:peptidoglycan/LPS O-acetylase OafA/YrhL
MQARLENIQALRGVAALMVLFAHVKGAEIDYGGGRTLLPHWPFMGVVGVDLFFLISGFVMTHVAFSGVRGRRGAARFLFNRGARIYPVYWTVTLLLMILYAGKQALFAEATPFPNPIETFLLLPDDHYPLVPVGWTLVHEIYFYVVFAVFVFWRGANIFAFLGAWAAIVTLGLASGFFAENAWTKIALNPLTFEFMVGALIACAVRRGVTLLALPALCAGVLLFALQTALFADRLYPQVMGEFALRAAIFTPPFALILYGAAALEQSKALVAPSWLRKTGDASYSLYLIHVPVFLVVGKLISIAIPDSVLDNAALIVANFAGALVAAFALHALVERPLLKATKKWGDRLFAGRHSPPIATEAA